MSLEGQGYENRRLPLSSEEVVNLYLPDGARYFVNSGDPEYIIITNPHIAYPRSPELPESVKALILEKGKINNPDVFLYPEYSILLGLALNEAASGSAAFEIEPGPREATIAVTDLLIEAFNSLTQRLKAVLQETQSLPETIDYRQIVIQKDTLDVKLLPPVELTPIGGAKELQIRRKRLVSSLLDSLRSGTTTKSHRSLYGQLEGPIARMMRKGFSDGSE